MKLWSNVFKWPQVNTPWEWTRRCNRNSKLQIPNDEARVALVEKNLKVECQKSQGRGYWRLFLSQIHGSYSFRQGRRLVINIGGAKIWVTNIGGAKNFWKYIFRKKFLKVPLNSLTKFWRPFFFSHRKFFSKKCTLFIEIYFLFFVFFFFSLCFCFLSCLFFLN